MGHNGSEFDAARRERIAKLAAMAGAGQKLPLHQIAWDACPGCKGILFEKLDLMRTGHDRLDASRRVNAMLPTVKCVACQLVSVPTPKGLEALVVRDPNGSATEEPGQEPPPAPENGEGGIIKEA